ncbi:MAG: TIGR00725 family protein [candidate division WOR-3 bacterium]
MRFFVAVLGPQEAERKICQLAKEVGFLIAQKGGVLITGGLGGVMEASCQGAKAAGGITIGILPTKDKTSANPYCDFPIATGLGEARNLIIIATADALIAIGKSWGTLSEISFALKMKKRVIGLKTFNLKGIIKVETPKEAVRKAFSNEGSSLSD